MHDIDMNAISLFSRTYPTWASVPASRRGQKGNRSTHVHNMRMHIDDVENYL